MIKLGPYELNSIIVGDAKELSRAIPGESVDLIFTDPVYNQIEDYAWLAGIAVRVLKPGGSVLAFCGHAHTLLAGSAMLSSSLNPGPILEHYVSGSKGRLFSHSVQCNVLPCLWFSKGSPTNQWMALQELSTPRGQRGHKWGKAEDMAMYRISRFTWPGDIVFDPFCGGGSTITACRKLGRNYLAFEIDPIIADLAHQRITQTQPPLPIVIPEQFQLDYSSKIDNETT